MSCSSDFTKACSSVNKNKKRRSKNTTRSSRWSDLPQELLEKIIQEHKENDISHVARVRAVCKSWRSCLPNPNLYLKPPPPFLASIPFLPKHNVVVGALEVVVVALLPLDPDNNPNGGILKLKRKRSGKLRAMNPLFDEQCVSNKITTISEVVNLLDYRVQLLHRSHYVEDKGFKDLDHPCMRITMIVVHGDIICALYGLYDKCYNLGFLKFGGEKWTRIEGEFEDITLYRDYFFALDSDEFLLVIDPLSLRVSKTVAGGRAIELGYFYYYRYKCLVESLGDLFLVLQHARDDCQSCILVYMLDKVKEQWRKIENLRDRIFFVGDPQCSFSVSATDFPLGVCKKRNCVYYTDYNSEVKGTVQRGLSTEYASLYHMEVSDDDSVDDSDDDSVNDSDDDSVFDWHNSLSAYPAAMNIFWNLKPRKRKW